MVLASTSLLLLHAGSSRSNGGGGIPPSPGPTASPTPTPTTTASPTQSPIPTWTNTPTPTQVPTFTPTLTPTFSATVTPTPSISATTTPTPTPSPTAAFPIWQWGSDAAGQFGLGTTAAGRPATITRYTPEWQQWFVASAGFSAWLRFDGTLWLSGSNAYGQLCQNNISNLSILTQENSFSTWNYLGQSAGASVFAVKAGTNKLWAAGENDRGKLGDNSNANRYVMTEVVTNVSNWAQVVSSNSNTYGTTTDGLTYGWGLNNVGQLNSATAIAEASTPVQICADKSFIQIASGNNNFIGLVDSGAGKTLWTTGYNSYGQIGNSSILDVSSLIQIGANNFWQKVSCTGDHVVALSTTGDVYTWGRNNAGQLGINSISGRSSPVMVASGVIDIQAGYRSTYIKRSDNSVWAVGTQVNFNIGTGAATNCSSFVQAVVGTEWSNPLAVFQGFGRDLRGGVAPHLAAFATPTPTTTASPTPTPSASAERALYGWGENTTGVLGLSNGVDRSQPVQIALSQYAAAGRAGNTTANANYLKPDGSLWLAGDNSVGQLAQNNITDRNSPVQEISLSTWLKAFTGRACNFAIKNDNTLWSWGSGVTNGLVGDGQKINRSSPVAVLTANTNWSTVSTGYTANAAITTTGELWVWGAGTSGQLGTNSITSRSSMVQLAGTNWSTVSFGDDFALALKTDGTAWSWGNNVSGQLGRNTAGINVSSPAQIGTESNWTQLSAGGDFAFGLKSDNTLWSWGSPVNYQNAQGQDTIWTSSPVQLAGSWKAVQAMQTCVYGIDMNNLVYAAGASTSGQLGLNGLGDTSLLTNIAGIEYIELVPVGAGTRVGMIWARPVVTPTPTPSPTVNVSPTPLPSQTVPPQNMALFGWGSNNNSSARMNGVTTSTISPPAILRYDPEWVSQVKSNVTTAAGQAVKFDGTLWMAGAGSSGQLGQGTALPFSSMVIVGTTNEWNTTIPVGSSSNTFFGIKQATGKLWAWGDGANRLIGDGVAVDRSSPVQVATTVNDWAAIVPSSSHVLALRTNGDVYAWGINTNGQFGDNTVISKSTPTQIGVLGTNFAQLATGTSFSAGVKKDGSLWTWGLNTSGQLGLNVVTQRNSPSQVGLGTDWSKALTGAAFMAGLKKDGTLYAWGANASGQLAQNNIINRSSPVQVSAPAGRTWTDIKISNANLYAIDSVGALWSAGALLGMPEGTVAASSMTQSTGLSGYQCISFPTAMGSLAQGSFVWAVLAAATPTPTLSPTTTASPTPTPSPTTTASPTPSPSESLTPTPSPSPSESPTPTPSPSAFNAWYLWSSNAQGQLNTGNTIAVQGPYNAFSAGDYPNIESGSTSTFRKFDGTLWGTGANASGALGQNDTSNRSSIVQIATNVVYNAANGAFTNFIKSDGTLWSSGNNTAGQLGINVATNRSSPVQEISGKTDWVKCIVGASASFAIDSSNRLYVTGNNLSGTLGLGNVINQSQFTQVGTDTTWSEISCGNTTAIATKVDGSMWGWGQNTSGQLGDGTATNKSSPIQIGIGSTWLKVTSANATCLALKSDNTVWGWGNNGTGQLGNADPTYTAVSSPIQILTGTWLDIDINQNAAFAINTNNELWGSGTASVSSPNLFTYPTQSSFIMLDNVRQWLSFSQVKGQNNNSMNAKALGPIAATPTPTPSPTNSPTPTPTIAPSSNIVGMSGSANLEAYGQNNGDFFAVLTPVGTDVASTFRFVVWNAALNEWLCTTDSGKFYYSTDGQNWTLATTITGFVNGMAFGYNSAGIPVVVFTVQISISDFRFGYTYDNRNFTVGTQSYTDAIYGVNYAGGNFVCLSIIVGEGVYNSCDGVNWTEVGTVPYSEIYNLGYNPANNRLVGCVGTGGVDVKNKAVYSDNYGATWTDATLPQTAPYRTCVWTGSKFAAINAYTGFIALSNDGITWTLGGSMSGAGNNIHKMCYYNGALYVMGLGYSIMWKSADQGTTWSQINLGTSSSWNTISGQEPLPTPNAPTCPPSPSPSPSPTLTPSPSPSESLTPSPTASPTSTPTPSPSESPTPTPSPSATCTPVPLPVTSGMVGWFDASDTSKINGGTPTNGVQVSSWGNSTTNATWTGMQQATSAKQPTWFSDGTVAGSYLLFDNTAGANADGMTTNGAYSLSGACTIVVMEDCFASISPSHRTVQSSSINGLISLNQYGGGTPIGCFYGASIVSGYQSGTGKHNGIMTKSAANAIKYYVDGTNRTSGSPSSASNWAQVCFGGAGANPNEPANTKLLEVIVYDRELSAAEVTQVSDYLQCKWTNPGPTPQPTIGPATASPTPSPSVAPATASPTPSPSASETPSPTPSASETPATPTPSPTIGTVGAYWGWGANTGGSQNFNNLSQIDGLYNIQASNYTQVCISSSLLGVKTDATLWACGTNASGQLAQNDTIARSSIVQIAGSWVRAVNNSNICNGIKTDGTLWAWGSMTSGASATNVGVLVVSSPVQEILGKTDWAYNSIGTAAQLAVDTSGRLWSVGSDTLGAQGQNTNGVNKSTFTQIGAGTDWSSCYVSNAFCAALKKDGTFYGWGANNTGQLGDNTVITKSSPVQLLADKVITRIVGATGGFNVLDNAGNLWGTGGQTQGQLGQNDIIGRSSYVQIASNVLDAIGNGSATLFIKTDNTLWGVGIGGAPLLNTSTVNVSSPIQLNNTFSWQNFQSVRGTFQSQYFVYALGIPQATPTTTVSPTPTPTPSPTPEALNWWGWGTGTSGQMGNGLAVNIPTLNNFYPISVYADVAIGNNGLFKKQDGTLWQAGLNSYGRLGIGTTINTSSQIQITGANFASFGIANVQTRIFPNGTLWSVGQGANGGLANNSIINQSSPVQESLGKTDWVKSYGFSNCQVALDSAGRLWSCGFNGQGQLGQNDIINRSQFVQIGAATNWVDVTTSTTNFIAKKNDGTYWTCGTNTNGQFGLNNVIATSSPIQIGAGYTIQKITGGSTITFILDNAGNIWSAGLNSTGTSGDGTIINKSSFVQMLGGPWIDVKPAANVVYMIKSDNTLWGVGSLTTNLSLGSASTSRSSPVMLDNTKTWLRFSEQVPMSNAMSAQAVEAGYPTPTPT